MVEEEPELVWELSALHLHWLGAYDPAQHASAPIGWPVRLSRNVVQFADLNEAFSEAGVVIVDASRDIGEAGR